MSCVLRPDQLRRSNSLSAVRSTESRTIAVAATIQSGNLCLTLRRSAIVSFLTSSVRSIVIVLSARKARRFSSSSTVIFGLENNSISEITLIKRSAAFSLSFNSAEVAFSLVARKITALVSSTKRLSIIPFVPNRPLVSYTVAEGVRRKNTEKMGKRPAVWVCGFFSRPAKSILKSTVGFANCGFFCRSKGKNHLPCRNFTRHVNSQPMAGRYFYGLRNGHGENLPQNGAGNKGAKGKKQ